MTIEPFFSVITITRNRLDGLIRTTHSLQTQTSSDYEWIVIDGASTDGTPDFLKTVILSVGEGTHAAGDPSVATHLQDDRIKWVCEPDAGIYDAMNKGVDRAKGRYVIFMNAGDEFAAQDVLDRIKSAARNNPDFIYGDARETLGNGQSYYKKARSHTRALWGMFTHHQAMLYRRAAIGTIRYDLKYKIAADYDFTLRILQNAREIAYYPFPICLFESGGLSQTNARSGRLEEFQIRKGKATFPKLCLIAGRQLLASVAREALPRLYYSVR